MVKENRAGEGFYSKYRLTKTDGTPCDPYACYFVLRLDTDEAAQKAMRVYAENCKNERLAADIIACLNELEAPPCRCREANCEHTPLFSMVWRYDGQ